MTSSLCIPSHANNYDLFGVFPLTNRYHNFQLHVFQSSNCTYDKHWTTFYDDTNKLNTQTLGTSNLLLEPKFSHLKIGIQLKDLNLSSTWILYVYQRKEQTTYTKHNLNKSHPYQPSNLFKFVILSTKCL